MSLKQVMDMLEGKIENAEQSSNGQIYVVLHAKQSVRTFVNIGKDEFNRTDMDPTSALVLYFDSNEWPGLVDDGEWNYYITESGDNTEIVNEDIRKILIEQASIPNRKYYKV